MWPSFKVDFANFVFASSINSAQKPQKLNTNAERPLKNAIQTNCVLDSDDFGCVCILAFFFFFFWCACFTWECLSVGPVHYVQDPPPLWQFKFSLEWHCSVGPA